MHFIISPDSIFLPNHKYLFDIFDRQTYTSSYYSCIYYIGKKMFELFCFSHNPPLIFLLILN